MKRKLPIAALLSLALLLTGCATGRQAAPMPGEPDRPVESFPEGSQVDPLRPDDVVPLMARGAANPVSKTEPDAVAVEDELLARINMARSQAGADMLEAEETLLWAARIRAEELREEFGHTRPDGTAYYTVLDEVGFSYSGKWHGENAGTLSFPNGAKDEVEIATTLYEDLTASQGHLNNMLRKQYGQIGVGVEITVGQTETTVTTIQLFASK